MSVPAHTSAVRTSAKAHAKILPAALHFQATPRGPGTIDHSSRMAIVASSALSPMEANSRIRATRGECQNEGMAWMRLFQNFVACMLAARRLEQQTATEKSCVARTMCDPMCLPAAAGANMSSYCRAALLQRADATCFGPDIFQPLPNRMANACPV